MSNDTDAVIVPFVITGKYKWFRKSVRIEFLKSRKISNNLDYENEKLMKIISKKVSDYRKGEINEKR